MAKELENTLKSVAAQVATYVKNAAEMRVETRYVEVGDGPADFNQARPVALTVIKLDGDSQTIMPLRQAEDGRLEIDEALFELHERNVNAAIAYRTGILKALLAALQPAPPE